MSGMNTIGYLATDHGTLMYGFIVVAWVDQYCCLLHSNSIIRPVRTEILIFRILNVTFF
jgi:hypothetical protein